jgi:hypothetical protein
MFLGQFGGIPTTTTRERVRTDLLSAIRYCIRASGENAPDWIKLGRL